MGLTLAERRRRARALYTSTETALGAAQKQLRRLTEGTPEQKAVDRAKRAHEAAEERIAILGRHVLGSCEGCGLLLLDDEGFGTDDGYFCKAWSGHFDGLVHCKLRRERAT